MSIQLRDYQLEAVARTLLAVEKPGVHPLIVLPTGAGKSLVIGEIINKLKDNTSDTILVLAHRKELLSQNGAAIAARYGGKITFYSNSINQKDLSGDVIVAGIASIARIDFSKLPNIRYILIDEAHLVNNNNVGQYRTLLNYLLSRGDVSVIGLSATPFRIKGGYLHKGEDSIFTEVSFEISISKLIDGGYLSELSNKSSAVRVDISDIKVRAGEFVAAECEKKFNNKQLIIDTVEDIISYSGDRHSWLIFCTGIEHATHVAEVLRFEGISAATILASTPPDERDSLIKLFKEKRLTALVSVDTLTTGFDAPNVDLLAILRPTKSPGLYIQIVGRGTRKYPGKQDCLILDYGQNIERFGPIDQIHISNHIGSSPSDTIPFKVCPECREVIHVAQKICIECEYEFPSREYIREQHKTKASDLSVLKSNKFNSSKFDGKTIIEIFDHKFVLHEKKNKPASVRIDYHLNMLEKVSEWICPEHQGYAKIKYLEWWHYHGISDIPVPRTAQELITLRHKMKLSNRIIVEVVGGFPTIVKRFFENNPHGVQ